MVIGLKIKENMGQDMPGHIKALLTKRLEQQTSLYRVSKVLKIDEEEIRDIETKIKVLCSKLNISYEEYKEAIDK